MCAVCTEPCLTQTIKTLIAESFTFLVYEHGKQAHKQAKGLTHSFHLSGRRGDLGRMKDEDGKTKGGDGRNTVDIKHSLWIIHSFCGTSLEFIIVRREWEECGITLCKSGMEKG